MPMAKTPTSSQYNYILYLTKHLRVDLHDRMRVQAALRDTTVEDIVNIALAVGIPIVETRTAESRRLRKQQREAAEG